MSTRLCVVVLAGVVALAACASDDGGGEAAPSDSALSGAASTTAPTVDAAAVPAEPSAGCGADQTGLEPETVQTVSVADDERQYQRHLPPAHDGRTPVPLVLDFHGYSEGAGIHALHSDLASFGDEAGFVTVTPQGQGVVPFWDASVDSTDIDFVGRLLDAEETSLCIDVNRIYSTGLSNGAFLTSAIACAHEDRIAAVAPVAGIRDPESCSFDRPVPVVAFHGTDDDFVAYDGGLGSSVGDLPTADGSGETLAEAGDVPVDGDGDSVPAMTQAWAVRNGCEPRSEEEQLADDVARLTFDCPAGAETELYRVDGGGHSWPGSDFSAQIESVVGPTTFSIDANEVMWDFFEDHPLT